MNLSDLMYLGQERPATESPSQDFTLRKTTIEHAIFCETVREVARVHMRGVRQAIPEGLLVVAQTGSGKSTMLEWYERKFPRTVVNGIHRIPVVRVATPEGPTVKTLAEAILVAMGDPAASKGTAQEKSCRILHFIKRCDVQILLIDEFQHFFDGRAKAECHRVSDWLKNFINLSKIPVVLCGLPRSIAVINMNPQLRRRFGAPVYMRPFKFTTKEDKREFCTVLKKVRSLVPVPCVNFYEGDLPERFYYASCGLMDYVVKIVDEAVTHCRYEQTEGVTIETLARAFESSIWGLAPPELNPFNPKANLRRLDRRLEPFDVWDDPAQYQVASA